MPIPDELAAQARDSWPPWEFHALEQRKEIISLLFQLANINLTQQKLDELLKLARENKVTDQEVKDLLNKVDSTTNKISANLTTVSDAQTAEANVVQAISDEIDALIAKGGLSPENAAQLQAIADRAQASSDASDAIAAATAAQATVLQGIAAKGAPVVPPPPPPVLAKK